jgi:ammonia channel protein AmtB
MHFRSFISFLILTAFAAGASWALGELAEDMKFSSFLIFGVVTVTMVSCGFAWDWFERRRS